MSEATEERYPPNACEANTSDSGNQCSVLAGVTAVCGNPSSSSGAGTGTVQPVGTEPPPEDGAGEGNGEGNGEE